MDDFVVQLWRIVTQELHRLVIMDITASMHVSHIKLITPQRPVIFLKLPTGR